MIMLFFVLIILLSVCIVYLSFRLSGLSREYVRIKQELQVQENSLRFIKENSNLELNRLESTVITLSDLARSISASESENEIFGIIIEKIVHFFEANDVAIFLVEKDTGVLKLAECRGYDKNFLLQQKMTADENCGFVGWSAKARRFVSLGDAEQDITLEEVRRNNKFDVVFAQPIVLLHEVLAVISVGKIGRKFKQTEVIRFMSILSNLSSIAINNIRLMNKFKEQSIKDGLTGLYNHSYFQSFLQETMRKVKEDNSMVSIAMIDLDNFKPLNDTCGHQSGDALLIELGRILNAHVGKDDIAARYGGDEFVLVLRNKDSREALEIAEKIRNEVIKRNFRFEEKDFRVSLSGGVACFDPKKSPNDMSKDKLIKQADMGLYQAKREGRNRIACQQAID